MSDTIHDAIMESEVEVLQLNMMNFGKWLVLEGLLSQDQVNFEPWRVAEAVEEHFEIFRTDQYELYRDYIEMQQWKYA